MTSRVLALDVGTVRLGVAVSDPTRTVATPVVTVQRADPRGDASALKRIAEEYGTTTVVVGLPLDLKGREAVAARQVRAYVDELAPLLEGFELRFVDERLSTVVAQRSLRAQGMGGRARRQVVDQVAATVFLQTWLDREAARRAAGTAPEPSEGGSMDTTP